MREKRLSVTELEDRFQLFKDEVIKSGKYNEKEHSDNMLHRFLRARKSDVPKALTMFSNYIQWRHDAEVDDIVQNYSFPEAAKVSEMYPRFYHKTDKLGRPVYFEILGKMHVEALFSVTSTERLIKGYIREYEKLLNYRFAACGLKIGKHIEQGCSVLDLKGVPLSQFNQVRKVVQQVSSVAQDYYPETLGKMFIINAPFLFKGIWQIVKPMLDENTVSKISVLGSNYESELFEVIDKSNVPVEFGGTCSCQGGCSKSDIGPWNDQSVPGYPIAFYEDFKKRDV
jgi:hypothetical protein